MNLPALVGNGRFRKRRRDNGAARRASSPGLVVLATFLVWVCPVGQAGEAAGIAEEAAGTERRLGELVDELNTLDAWLDDAGERLAGFERDVAAADREVASTGRRIRDLETEFRSTRTTLATLTEERRAFEQRRREQAGRIARHVRDAHRFVGHDFLKVLLSQDDPTAFERMIRYHGYFSRARLDAVADYRRVLVTLGENERVTTERRRALADQQEELTRHEAALVTRREERAGLIDALSGEMSDRVDRRDRLAADRARLESLLAELQRRAKAAEATRFAQSKGHLNWPVAGRVVRHFGQPRAGGRLTWEGVYFEASPGAEVTAIHGGRVVFADWLRGFGLLTIVDHGDGHMSLYGNADVLFKNVGDWVEGGEPIAAAGRSGAQSQSGLYLEIRSDGRPTNPIAWLEKNQPDQ